MKECKISISKRMQYCIIFFFLLKPDYFSFLGIFTILYNYTFLIILFCVLINEIRKHRCTRGYKQDKIEMRGDRAEMSDFPLYLNTVAGGLDRRDQTIGGFSFVVKIYAVPVVEIIG